MLHLPAPVFAAREHAVADLCLDGELLAAWAPGRVNLIGEHTDYNEGWVLPIAIERCVALVGSPRAGDHIDLYSAHHREKAAVVLTDLPTSAATQGQPLWARYIAGAVGELRDAGYVVDGFDVAIAGDVPLGAGLSSSAALVVATLTWLAAAFHLDIAPLEIARIGQRAETRGSGVRVGILDHAASVLGRPNQAVLIDCRSLDHRYIPFRLPDVNLLICESGVERSLAKSSYNTRVAECRTAVDAFARALQAEGDVREIKALRDIEERDYLRLAGQVVEPARHRARHIVSENARTLAATEAIEAGDATTFGDLLLRSHASLRDDYAVSIPELDGIVSIATLHGALGARLVGAGFGGSALVMTAAEHLDEITMALHAEYAQLYGKETLLHLLRPAGGPGTAPLPAGT